MSKVKHVPHREAPEATLSVVSDFCNRILREDWKRDRKRERDAAAKAKAKAAAKKAPKTAAAA